jgi:hypothetical protein
MEVHEAKTVFRTDDLPLFKAKLRSAMAALGQAVRGEQFRRVVEVAGLPDLDDAAQNGTLNGERLMEVRRSQECIAFRDWLAKSDSLSDDEIKKLTRGMLAMTSRLLYSPTGRILRYVALAGIGVYDTATGLALGAVDTFILDKLVPVRGPLSFLDDKYRSIYQDDPTEE